MEGGGGEVGYEVIMEGAIEICIIPRIFECRPGCSNGLQTIHYHPIASNW